VRKAPQNLPGINTPAYLAAESVTKKRCFVTLEQNDNVPNFETNEPKVIFAKSDSAIGQPIHRVAAEDADLGDNGRVGFQLEDKSGYFSIEQSEGERLF